MRRRNFKQMAEGIDNRLIAAGRQAIAVDIYKRIYGSLSTYAHPRTRGIRIEFNKAGDCLIIDPEWEPTYCLDALIAGIDAARFNLLQFCIFVSEVFRRNEGWLTRVDGTIDKAVAWLTTDEHGTRL